MCTNDTYLYVLLLQILSANYEIKFYIQYSQMKNVTEKCSERIKSNISLLNT